MGVFIQRLPNVYDYMVNGKFIRRVRKMEQGWFISSISGFYAFNDMVKVLDNLVKEGK